jgi:ABC-2 type transport system ATP-binding protein
MIRVRDLRVDYDELCAVRDVGFAVGPGEVCGLIGPNGAGKTTTMRALLGLLEPTYGEIEILGVDIRERPRDVYRDLGFMPDFPPAYDDLLCWEFLDLFAASYFVPRSRRREVVNQHLDLVGLADQRKTRVGTLSRGMRQRLMLAKTLIPEPKVILFDEPASGMDPQGRIMLKRVLRELAAQQRAVLISSHILAEMTEFCTSVVIMEKGQVVVHGSIEEVRRLVSAGVQIEIEVVDELHRLEEFLRDQEHIGPLERLNPTTLRIHFAGDPQAAHRLLAALVAANLPVVSFHRHKAGMEEIFLKVGAKELS